MECVVCMETKDRSSLFLCDHIVCEDCARTWAGTQRNSMQVSVPAALDHAAAADN